MRPIRLALLSTALVLALPAQAQQADAACDPQIMAGIQQQAEVRQQEAAADARAVNDYYKKIKEGVSNAEGKLLSCVDIAWPDLPFSGMLPMVEQFIKNVGDKAVAQACNKMRDKVRDATSLFSEDNLKAKVLGSLGDAGDYAGDLLDGDIGGVVGGVIEDEVGGGLGGAIGGDIGGKIPPTNPLIPRRGGEGGGLIDLLKPKPKNPPPGQPPREP